MITKVVFNYGITKVAKPNDDALFYQGNGKYPTGREGNFQLSNSQGNAYVKSNPGHFNELKANNATKPRGFVGGLFNVLQGLGFRVKGNLKPTPTVNQQSGTGGAQVILNQNELRAQASRRQQKTPPISFHSPHTKQEQSPITIPKIQGQQQVTPAISSGQKLYEAERKMFNAGPQRPAMQPRPVRRSVTPRPAAPKPMAPSGLGSYQGGGARISTQNMASARTNLMNRGFKPFPNQQPVRPMVTNVGPKPEPNFSRPVTTHATAPQARPYSAGQTLSSFTPAEQKKWNNRGFGMDNGRGMMGR